MRVVFAGQIETALNGVTGYLAKGDLGNALLLLTQTVREISIRMATDTPIGLDEIWALEETLGRPLDFADPLPTKASP